MASRTVIFYILIEYSTFITSAWEIAKEVSYVAVSKEALDILFREAEFKKPPEALDSIHSKARSCSHQVWRATIECLRLGSPWQHFSAAVTCTLLRLYSLPVRKRADHSPPTEALGFGYSSQSHIREIIEKFHKFGQTQLAPKRFKIPYGVSPERQVLIYERFALKRDVKPKAEDLTFIRLSQRKQVSSIQQEHTNKTCQRCLHMGPKYGQDHTFFWTDESSISGYGMVLVETLDLTSEKCNNHDLCLFTFDSIFGIDDNSALGVVVEDLLQSSFIFHTIRHPLPRTFASKELLREDILWNLPLPYRPITRKQRFDCRAWFLELQGQTIPDHPEDIQNTDYWSKLQLFLHGMKSGASFEESCNNVKAILWDANSNWSRERYYGEVYRKQIESLEEKDIPPGLKRVGGTLTGPIGYVSAPRR